VSVTGTSASTTYNYDNALTTANLLQRLQWDSAATPPANISNSWTYAANGNVLTATDANTIVTNTVYDSCGHPQEVDLAYGLSGQQRTITQAYDCNSGLLTTSTDYNNVTMTYAYDNLGRQTKVEEAGSGGLDRWTSTTYDDVGLSVTTTQHQTGLTTASYYDPLGRVRLTVDEAGNKVQAAYRAGSGGVSYQLASAPYASTGSPAAWTLTTRNANPATATVQTYAGASAPAPWVSGSGSSVTGATVTTCV
jgi:YD repeat-containing protein